MYYPDGAGLFGEELVRLPDGRVVTREQAMNFQYSGRGVAGMPMPPQGRGAGEVDMNRLRQPMAPPTPARTAPIPTAQPKAPVYSPNPALMAAEAGASTPKPEEPSGFGGMLDWMGKNPEKKQSFDQSDVLMALGSGMLGLSADPNLQKLGAAGFGQVAERRDERKTTAMTNRTVDALVGSGMIKPEQAEILRNNPALIKEVYAASLKGDDAAIARYKWLLDNPEQAAKLKQLGAIGGGVNVDLGNFGNTDVEELRKKLAGGESDVWNAYLQAGGKSAALMQDIDLLEQAAMAAPTGPVTGRLLELFPEANNNAAVFNAILQRVAPTMRVEGSGSTSDIEFEGMLKSLGSLRNSPEANQMIYGAFRAKAQLNMERANIVRTYLNGDYTEKEARNKLYELDSRSILPPELKSIVEAGSRDSVAPKYQQYYDQLPPERQKLFDTLSDADKDRLVDAWFRGKVQ